MGRYQLSFSFNNAYIEVALKNYAFTSCDKYGFITTSSINFTGDNNTVRDEIKKVLDDLSVYYNNQKFKLVSKVIDRFTTLLDEGNMDIDLKDILQQNWAKFFNIKLCQLKDPVSKITKQYCIDSKTFESMRDELTASMYSLSNLKNILVPPVEEQKFKPDRSSELIAKKIQEIWQQLNDNVLKVLEDE